MTTLNSGEVSVLVRREQKNKKLAEDFVRSIMANYEEIPNIERSDDEEIIPNNKEIREGEESPKSKAMFVLQYAMSSH
jgi:hypothetical protein